MSLTPHNMHFRYQPRAEGRQQPLRDALLEIESCVCPTVCTPDCTVRCHEVHHSLAARVHDPSACLAAQR